MTSTKIKNVCKFSRKQDKILIKRVQFYSALYDTTQKDYKNKYVRGRIWQEIGETVQRSGADCKTRWRTLRDLYNRKLRENMRKTGSLTGNGLPWKYMDQMAFLKRVSNDKKFLPSLPDTTDSIVQVQTAKNQMGINESELMKYAQDEQPNRFSKEWPLSDNMFTFTKKNKDDISRDQIAEIVEKESEETMDLIGKIIDSCKNKTHPIEQFFDNIAKMVIEFPPALVTIAKYEVNKIVSNLEYDSLSSYLPECYARSLRTSSSESCDNSSTELHSYESCKQFCSSKPLIANDSFQSYISSAPPSCSTDISE